MEILTKPPYLLSLLLHLYSLFFFSTLSIARDAILPGQFLSGDQTISSKGGIFELGFFTLGNTQNYYIGIWYKQVPGKTVVWVANREKPLSGKNNSQFKLEHGCNLVLVNQLKERVWSSNVDSTASSNTTAELLDTGNLVVRDASDASVIIWQSFDHPTDTWLPKAELGRNKITGERNTLVAWRSYKDPSPGLFSLMIDPSGSNQYVSQWNGSKTYWKSGVWNGESFDRLPGMILMMARSSFNFGFVDTKNKSYFSYYPSDSSVLARTLMEASGQMKLYTLQNSSKQWIPFWSGPIAQCDVYSFCGVFGICNEKSQPFCSCLQGFEPRSPEDWKLQDWSGGCLRKTNLQCSLDNLDNGKQDRFWKIQNVKLPANSHMLVTKSAKECETSCLNNCTCTAYTFNNGCLMWNGDLVNLEQLPDDEVGQDLFVRLDASEMKSLGPNKRATIRAATLGTFFGVACALGVTLFLIWRWKRKQNIRSLEVDEGSLVSFSYEELQSITKKFSEKLGRGSFGSVYKGSLPNSTSIAVKMLEGLMQGEKQFRTEVSTIGTIQHINLIRLRGFCAEGTKRLLVYDYMTNGSLDSHLFHKTIQTIDWNIRFQIVLGIARGLAYLHEKCRDCIIHCDIKPENILLDAEFCPKVSDFGMAKLVGRDFSRVLTSMRGTIGYLAPEWITGVSITPKADVFSYGMMLFEIISGKRTIEQFRGGESVLFPCFAARKIAEGEVLSLLDYRLEGKVNIEELNRACRVACWCIQDCESDRPSMGQVVQMLEGVIEIKLPPVPWSMTVLANGTAP